MKQHKLRIGRISYANLFPVFYTLERECDCSGYEFIEGVPSNLNQMLRNGEIDVSPSSSVEYLRHSDKYSLIDGHSISSAGHIGSITLFSKKPIEALDGLTVLTSSHSETSVALLEIIFKRFYKIECDLMPAELSLTSHLPKAEAYLLIGDDALKAVKSYEFRVESENQNFQLSTLDSEIMYAYDLGDLWHKHTGLPFTFALWIYRKERIEKTGLLERFKKDLDKAKVLALKNMEEIASASSLRDVLSEDAIITYWRNMSYDFGDEHKKGLELFRKYSEELGLV